MRAHLNIFRLLRVALLVGISAIPTSCQTWQPTALNSAHIEHAEDVPAFKYWIVGNSPSGSVELIILPAETPASELDESTAQADTAVPRDCARFVQKEKNRRGVIIGCHEITLVDTRGEGYIELSNLEQHQACGSTPISKTENRYYIINRSNFVYIDWSSGAAYFVPEGYVSDAVSFPDWLRSIAPGPIFDVIHPKTLAASLIHDRYLCLANHSARWATEHPSQNNYRSKRAVNDAFRDVSLTTGSAAIFSQIARGAVGLANPQRGPAFVPTTHLTELLELESALEEGKFRSLIRQARAKDAQAACLDIEPVFLCLTREENLIAMMHDPEVVSQLRAREWYEAIAYLACFSHRSQMMRRWTGSSYLANPSDREAPCDISDPRKAASGFQPNIDMDDRMALRLGDVLIESAFLLSRKSGRDSFASLAAPEASFDELMPLILNRRLNYVEQLMISPAAIRQR